jgi:hypothetical protein
MIGGLLYDDETRALKMIDEPPSHNLGHDLIRVVYARPALEPECEGERVRQVVA